MRLLDMIRGDMLPRNHPTFNCLDATCLLSDPNDWWNGSRVREDNIRPSKTRV